MNQKKGPRPEVPGDRAFTLLEVVIAMLLLGIGLLALMALQIRSVRSNAFSNSMTVASCFARNQVESLRAANWDDINDGTFFDKVSDTDQDTGATRMAFNRQWVIQTNGRMKNVSVTVSWNQYGNPHEVTVNTMIAKRQ